MNEPIISIIPIILLVTSGIFFGAALTIHIFEMDKKITIQGSTIAGFEGNSMLPLLIPEKNLIITEFDNLSHLKCGHIYIYEVNVSKTVVHRFVYETDDGKLVFKGDNNDFFDNVIDIEDIRSEVVGLI